MALEENGGITISSKALGLLLSTLTGLGGFFVGSASDVERGSWGSSRRLIL